MEFIQNSSLSLKQTLWTRAKCSHFLHQKYHKTTVEALPFLLCGHIFMPIIEATSQFMADGLHNLNDFTVSFDFIHLTYGSLGSWLWNWIPYQLHCWKWQCLIMYRPDKIQSNLPLLFAPCMHRESNHCKIRRCSSWSSDRCSSD